LAHLHILGGGVRSLVRRWRWDVGLHLIVGPVSGRSSGLCGSAPGTESKQVRPLSGNGSVNQGSNVGDKEEGGKDGDGNHDSLLGSGGDVYGIINPDANHVTLELIPNGGDSAHAGDPEHGKDEIHGQNSPDIIDNLKARQDAGRDDVKKEDQVEDTGSNSEVELVKIFLVIQDASQDEGDEAEDELDGSDGEDPDLGFHDVGHVAVGDLFAHFGEGDNK